MGRVASSSLLVPISRAVNSVLRLVLCVSYNINIIKVDLNNIEFYLPTTSR